MARARLTPASPKLLTVSKITCILLFNPPNTLLPAVKPQPVVTLTPVNDSPDVTASSTYTIAMIDADIVGANQTAGQTRHWLVNGVKATGEFCALLSRRDPVTNLLL